MGCDVSNLEARLKHRRGPMPGIGAGRGPGRPWAGIVEETRAVWVTWLTDYARQTGKPIPQGLTFSQGSYVPIVGVRLTFGTRYFFKCPECGRRCEAVYILGRRVACRKCLHLGYRSQASRAGSAWGRWKCPRCRQKAPSSMSTIYRRLWAARRKCPLPI